MNKITQIVVTASLTLTALAFGTSGAHAESRLGTCEGTGPVIGYGYVGEEIGDHVTDEDNTIYEFVCHKNGMRLYKAKANTANEVLALTEMAEHDAKVAYPIVVCETGPESAYVVDLAYFYTTIKKINHAERTHYKTHVTRYAERHDCTLYGG